MCGSPDVPHALKLSQKPFSAIESKRGLGSKQNLLFKHNCRVVSKGAGKNEEHNAKDAYHRMSSRNLGRSSSSKRGNNENAPAAAKKLNHYLNIKVGKKDDDCKWGTMPKKHLVMSKRASEETEQ
jgi:hypothetical protein